MLLLFLFCYYVGWSLVHLSDPEGLTAFHHAAIFGHTELIQVFLKYSMNVNQTDNKNRLTHGFLLLLFKLLLLLPLLLLLLLSLLIIGIIILLLIVLIYLVSFFFLPSQKSAYFHFFLTLMHRAALYLACLHGHTDFVRNLLQYCHDVKVDANESGIYIYICIHFGGDLELFCLEVY